jgi:hypothetical protein
MLIIALLVPLVASLYALVAPDVRAAGRLGARASAAAAIGLGAVAWRAFARGPQFIGDVWMVDRFGALLVILIQVV